QPGFVYLGQCRGDEQWAQYRQENDPLLNTNGQRHQNNQRATNRKPAPSWDTLVETYRAALTPEKRAELALALGLREADLDALPIGHRSQGPHRFEEPPEHRPCWTFPMKDAAGNVVGIVCRYPAGAKKAWPGCRQGLYIPDGWRERD